MKREEDKEGRGEERLEQSFKLYTVNNGTYCITVSSSGTLFTIRTDCSLEEDNSISTSKSVAKPACFYVP